MNEMLTGPEIEKIVRHAVREELADAGLRLHDEDHQDEARLDFLFLRRIRTAYSGAASKVGGAVILSLTTGAIWLLWAGIQTLWPPK